MYTLTITNNYHENLGGRLFAPPPPPKGGGYRIWDIPANGGKEVIPSLGSFFLTVPAMGDLLLLDLGNQKLSQYTNPSIPWTNSTWGGLVRYRTLDAYFRYEGGGTVDLVVDQYGSVQVKFAQGGMMVSLDDLTVG